MNDFTAALGAIDESQLPIKCGESMVKMLKHQAFMQSPSMLKITILSSLHQFFLAGINVLTFSHTNASEFLRITEDQRQILLRCAAPVIECCKVADVLITDASIPVHDRLNLFFAFATVLAQGLLAVESKRYDEWVQSVEIFALPSENATVH